jgi:hypothetical protein
MKMEQRTSNGSQPPTERDLVEFATTELAGLLPEGWSLLEEPRPPEADGKISISAPDGRSGSLLIEAKSLMNPRDVLFALDQMVRFGEGMDRYLMVARYLSPRARDLLEGSGVSYADSTGNVWLSLGSPGLLIRTQGEDRDPYRAPERGISSLKGGPASRVVRALADCRPPWTMRDLAEVAGTSLASTSRTIDFLDREALVTRNDLGSIIEVDWQGALSRWAADYELLKNRGRVTNLVAPRGLETALTKLRGWRSPYALTGSHAAQPWAPYADPRLGLIYTRDTAELQDRLGASPAQATPNMIAIEPKDDLPFMRTVERNGLRLVAPSQAVVDLLVGPGRNPSEGAELLRWMGSHESEWRER